MSIWTQKRRILKQYPLSNLLGFGNERTKEREGVRRLGSRLDQKHKGEIGRKLDGDMGVKMREETRKQKFWMTGEWSVHVQCAIFDLGCHFEGINEESNGKNQGWILF